MKSFFIEAFSKAGKSNNNSTDSWINFLRGIAILLVVGWHVTPKFKIGFIGVDIFFVISGFLLAKQMGKIANSNFVDFKMFYREYLMKRILRIYPPLFLFSSLTLCFFLLLGNRSDIKSANQAIIFSILGIQNLNLMNSDEDYFGTKENPFMHLWSLSVELQVYVGLPIALFLLKRSKVLSITTILFAPLAVFISSPHTENYFFTYARLWEFAVGGCVAHCSRNFTRLMPLMFLGLIVAVWVSVIFLGGGEAQTLSLLAVLITSVLLKLGWQGPKPIVHLGKISYSIYLYHLPLIFLAKYSLPLMDLPYNFRIILALFATYIFSLFSWTYIEKLYILKSKKIWHQLKVLSAVSVFMLLISYYISSFSGNPQVHYKPSFALHGTPCRKLIENALPCLLNEYNRPISIQKLDWRRPINLLIGDSQASQFGEAFIKASASSQKLILVAEGCRFTKRNLMSVRDQECDRRVKAIFEIVKQFQFNKIIFSNAIEDLYESQQILEFVQLLKKYGEVMVIGPSPVFPDRESYFAEGPIWYKSPKPAKFVTRSAMNRQEVHMKFANNFHKEQKISYIDLYKVFCDIRFCSRFKKDLGYLFFDINHLSVAGSYFVFENFSLSLKESLKVNQN